MGFLRYLLPGNYRGQNPPGNSAAGVILSGILRLIGALIVINYVALIGIQLFEPEGPYAVARQIQENSSFSEVWMKLPTELFLPVVPLSSGHLARYMLAPFGAIVFVLIAGACYVQDIYNLPSIKPALGYVLSSMLGLFYPKLVIDAGRKVIPEDKVNVLDVIGGPGYVLIQPGNAVMFRTLDGQLQSSVTRSFFLSPFERIGYVTNLDDQHGHVPNVKSMSRDGIKVNVSNIHFRFRILMQRENGRPVPRTHDNPFPFQGTAMINMFNNLNISETGQSSWHQAVQRTITSGITDFIASHGIDYLTAPRSTESDPRAEIRRGLFGSGITGRLAAIGAELLWVDIGHIEIEAEDVDEQRISLWNAQWSGNANIQRAFSDATRLAYQELGRAESQAEMILSISDALQSVDMDSSQVENLRRVLLARTAQILEAMQDNGHSKDEAL